MTPSRPVGIYTINSILYYIILQETNRVDGDFCSEAPRENPGENLIHGEARVEGIRVGLAFAFGMSTGRTTCRSLMDL